jgi:hypothetical protein
MPTPAPASGPAAQQLPPTSPYPHPSAWQQNPQPHTSPGAQAVYYQYQHTTNGMAVAAIIATACTLFTGLGWIFGLIFGHIALNQLKHNPQQRGRGLALAAVIIGWIIAAFFALLIGVLLIVVAGAA